MTNTRNVLVLVASVVLAACALGATPHVACAQHVVTTDGIHYETGTTLDPAARELSSIDGESHTATAFYILSPVLLGASVGFGAAAFANTCWYYCSGSSSSSNTYGALTAVSLGLSFVSLIIAIALDADSGSRRGGWQRRYSSDERASLRLTGGAGDVGLGLAGDF